MNNDIMPNEFNGVLQTIGDFIGSIKKYKRIIIPFMAGILSAWVVYKAMKEG